MEESEIGAGGHKRASRADCRKHHPINCVLWKTYQVIALFLLCYIAELDSPSQLAFSVKDGVDQLNRHQDDQEHRAILDWLTPTDYTLQKSDFLARRQEGTGQWFLESNEFQRWLNTSKQTLFCPGIPGAGKTVISSMVVDHLNAKFEKDTEVGIAYVYCSYQLQRNGKLQDLLSSLVKQLVQKKPVMLTDIKNLCECHRTKGTRPSFEDIVNVLHPTIQLYSRVFIIIDALDEYHVSQNELKELLSKLFDLRDRHQVNLFATSRFISEITSQFNECIWKEIRAQDDDVLSYVNGRIPQLLRSHISNHPEVETAIRRDIVKCIDGMYVHSSVSIYP